MAMADLEQIYEDKKAWTFFEGEENETISVYRRCPKCSKYITKGTLLMNKCGDIKLHGWKCKIHGEVEPYYDRNCV